MGGSKSGNISGQLLETILKEALGIDNNQNANLIKEEVSEILDYLSSDGVSLSLEDFINIMTSNGNLNEEIAFLNKIK